jgi:GTP-binding protein
VVRVGLEQSFVIADIPGVIEGAAEGAGLGVQFLKHLSRTRLLLHLVDVAPLDENEDPTRSVRQVVAELKKYSRELAARERWLVLTKKDVLTDADFAKRRSQIVRALRWRGPVFGISSVSGAGLDELMQALMRRIDEIRRGADGPVDAPAAAYHPLD